MEKANEGERRRTRDDGPVGELERPAENDVAGQDEDDRARDDGGEAKVLGRGEGGGQEGDDAGNDDSVRERECQYSVEKRKGKGREREGTHSKRDEYRSLRETRTWTRTRRAPSGMAMRQSMKEP